MMPTTRNLKAKEFKFQNFGIFFFYFMIECETFKIYTITYIETNLIKQVTFDDGLTRSSISINIMQTWDF